MVKPSCHDGQPLAGRIRSAWEGILEDASRRSVAARHLSPCTFNENHPVRPKQDSVGGTTAAFAQSMGCLPPTASIFKPKHDKLSELIGDDSENK